MTPRLAGVELGGTKSIAVLSDGDAIVARYQVASTDPAATLAALVATVAQWHAAAPLAALGIGSFGPLRLDADGADFGQMAATPKPGWSGVDIRGPFARSIAVPIGFDTDVAGAALAEGRWGAAQGCSDYIYVTIGTGVGFGIVANGTIVHGRTHPEAGHLRVRRGPGDAFAGACPFHGDCLEGLVSGPALAARTGMEGDRIADAHPVWTSVADELAEAFAMLLLTLAPQRIVVGGGIAAKRPHLIPLAVARTAVLLGGYLGDTRDSLARRIVAPGLGDDAGPRGALALALAALAESAGKSR
jgi:fructokinase